MRRVYAQEPHQSTRCRLSVATTLWIAGGKGDQGLDVGKETGDGGGDGDCDGDWFAARTPQRMLRTDADDFTGGLDNCLNIMFVYLHKFPQTCPAGLIPAVPTNGMMYTTSQIKCTCSGALNDEAPVHATLVTKVRTP